jgi:hypothetical protein
MLRVVLLAVLLVGLTGCTRTPEPAATPAPPAPGASATAAVADPSLPVARVYKSATCGCCSLWVEHMRREGFTVEVTDTPELAAIKDTLGVPAGLGSCHTARIGDYVVEGHVPAADVKRLLRERPEGVTGIAVPGMPIGSPGMEVPGRPADPYTVVAFGPAGEAVFQQHR